MNRQYFTPAEVPIHKSLLVSGRHPGRSARMSSDIQPLDQPLGALNATGVCPSQASPPIMDVDGNGGASARTPAE